jgi:hypothetical protein
LRTNAALLGGTLFLHMLICAALIVQTGALAADGENGIDYPHFMYHMEVGDFGDNFKTLGKQYVSEPIIVPHAVSAPDDSYYLRKSEGNDYVYIAADGYAGWGEHCYTTLVNAVEAYFGGDAARFVRDNFDYAEFFPGGKQDVQIGDYTFGWIKGNNHSGYEVKVRRAPVFLDLVGYESFDINAAIKLVGDGVVKGMGGGIFAPDESVTRAQFSVMLARLLGVSGGEYKGLFADVPQEEWYAAAVEAFADMGYIRGYGDGKFHPDDTISYQDMFVFTYNCLRDMDMLPEVYRDPPNVSEHIDGIADYAKTAIDELYARGLVNLTNLETADGPGSRICVVAFLSGIIFK